jgi:hypothetical protein
MGILRACSQREKVTYPLLCNSEVKLAAIPQMPFDVRDFPNLQDFEQNIG